MLVAKIKNFRNKTLWEKLKRKLREARMPDQTTNIVFDGRTNNVPPLGDFWYNNDENHYIHRLSYSWSYNHHDVHCSSFMIIIIVIIISNARDFEKMSSFAFLTHTRSFQQNTISLYIYVDTYMTSIAPRFLLLNSFSFGTHWNKVRRRKTEHWNKVGRGALLWPKMARDPYLSNVDH